MSELYFLSYLEQSFGVDFVMMMGFIIGMMQNMHNNNSNNIYTIKQNKKTKCKNIKNSNMSFERKNKNECNDDIYFQNNDNNRKKNEDVLIDIENIKTKKIY